MTDADRWERIQARAIAELADTELTLVDFAAAATADAETYRRMLQLALAQLHEATVRERLLRERIREQAELIRSHLEPGASTPRRLA